MFNNSFEKDLISLAKNKIAKIVLPEASYSAEMLKAAITCAEQKIAKVVVIAKSETDFVHANLDNVADKTFFEVVNLNNFKDYDLLLNKLVEIRKHKGLTKESAEQLLQNELYFATLMLECGFVDGMVVGAENTTADALRPPLQIIKAKQNNNSYVINKNNGNNKNEENNIDKESNKNSENNKSIISSFFIMVGDNKKLGHNGIFVLSDCAINENPSVSEVVDITFSTVASAKTLIKGISPKVALLSYSTKGSANGEHAVKMREATSKIIENNPDFIVDGEFQLDAAIINSVGVKKAKNSLLKGEANVLIFPDLSSGNISYKLMQHIAGYTAIGPICQGFKKPVNDVSRGASYTDILLIIAITSLQSQNIMI